MASEKPFYDQHLNILGISILIGGVLTYFTCPICSSSFKYYAIVSTFSISMWYFLWSGNNGLAHYLDAKVSWIDQPIKRLIVGILATIIYSVSIVAIILIIWENAFKFNLGDFFSIILYSLIITFFISLTMHSRAFLLCWKQSQIAAEKFKRESVAAQYESLKSQVNPHFLFNSLNALTNLVYEDPDKAAKFIKQLSEVYRYVLDTREKEVVPLEEELKFLHSYIFLQEIRFGKNLKIQIELNHGNTQVAPLALQLLIENAIKQNVISSDDPLHIRVHVSGDFIVVENNLQKKSILGESSSGLGLENIRKRYSFLTDKEVQITEGDGKFYVKLPIIKLDY